MTRRRIHRTCGVAAIAVVAMSGCAIVQPGSQPDDTRPSATTSAEPSGVNNVERVAVPPETVVATAHIKSDIVGAQGSIEILAVSPVVIDEATVMFEIRLTGFTPPVGRDMNQLRLIAQPTSGIWPCEASWGGLPSTDWTFADGQWRTFIGLRYSGDPPQSMGATEDPSFLESLVLLGGATEADENGCSYLPIVRADFVWSMPATRPSLGPFDSGARSGAGGSTATSSSGAPATYQVAPNDLIEDVAGRFGISVDDLMYLNPTRTASGPNEGLYAGELLNLARVTR